MKRTMTVLAAILTAVAAMVSQPIAAQAAPSSSGNFGAYPYENSYPTVAGCSGTFFLPWDVPGGAVQYANWEGRQVKLEFYYSNACGAYARISNAPQSCVAMIHRDSNGDRRADGSMSESVDPGINYAYTRIANNLNGRLAQAALVCRNVHGSWALASTGWY
ncbi:hypothetical protein Kfla_5591 [Kribbella flavida DSM 17836]|uniref:Uncharacterized protein n=1 Tax=Kribbella flavida (strain DSM 17836 / JCM 10339 / NBRC 14399) TaxID=479435 RepID=D2PNB3_KRIFD|nr:hypothetical protein [Kribbella flavida]ADB34597.1 hypothetical protein Kfla_5591 [Kribbella flavida DSM 17836]